MIDAGALQASEASAAAADVAWLRQPCWSDGLLASGQVLFWYLVRCKGFCSVFHGLAMVTQNDWLWSISCLAFFKRHGL